MKLIHPDLSFKLEFNETNLNLLILENRVFFRETILELLGQSQGEEGGFVLSQANKELDMNKYVELVINPLDLGLNSRKIINKLYADLETSIVDEDNYQATMKIKSQLQAYISQVLDTVDYQLDYSMEIDFKQIFKAMDLKIEEAQESYLESLLNYMWTIRQVFSTKLFIFVNLKTYLSDHEYKSLYEFLVYEKISVLIIENKQAETSYPWEKTWIIDEDICDIY